MNNKFLRKQAGVYSDALLSIIPDAIASSVVPGSSLIAGVGHGGFSGIKSPLRELREVNENESTALVPGVGASRAVRRQRALGELLAKENKGQHLWAHRFGAALLNPLNTLATIPAGVVAAITPGHTVADRRKALNDPNARLKTWLIPGYGTYQYYKDQGLANRLGHMNPIKARLATIDPVSAGLTGGGALAGGLAGGLASKDNKLRNALLGAALGAGAGYATDYLRRKNPDVVASLKDKLGAVIR